MNQNYQSINNEFVTWLDTLGFADGTVYSCKNLAAIFFEWLESNHIYHITQLTGQNISSYFEYLQTRPNKTKAGGLSVSSLNDNFFAIDKLLEFLHQIGMNSAPLPTGFRLHVDKQERINNIEPFTQQEIKELQAHIPDTYPNVNYKEREIKHEQLKLIFVLYYGCGLRRIEGYNLRVNDIDFENKTIFIRQGKNYKDRIVPMNGGVYKALQHYMYNFRNLQKVRHKRLFIYAVSTLSKNLKELQATCNSESIKNKRLSLHILRHSIATHLLQNGMSIENISRFLGHSSLDSTQIYTHIAMENKPE